MITASEVEFLHSLPLENLISELFILIEDYFTQKRDAKYILDKFIHYETSLNGKNIEDIDLVELYDFLDFIDLHYIAKDVDIAKYGLSKKIVLLDFIKAKLILFVKSE